MAESAKSARKRVGPLAKLAQFVQEVRSETSRVHWPSRKEVGVTTLMVLGMTAVAMLFLFMVDQVLRVGIEAIIGLGGG